MRLPVTPQLSTKDDTANKNARLTNALREKDKAVVRPGLSLALDVAGVGNGLVPWGDRLLALFADTVYDAVDPGGGSGDIFPLHGAALGQYDLGEYAHTYQTTMDFGQYSHTTHGIGTFGEIDLGEYPRVIRQFGTFGQFDLGEYAANMPNAFDPAYKYSSIVLSNRNRSVTSSDPQFGGVLSTIFKSTGTGGKYYCEFTLVSVPGGFNIG